MQRLVKSVLLSFVVIAAFFSSGCIDKTFFPATELEVTSVDPYVLIATATDTASLPTAQINVKSLSKVACTLRSISMEYYTSLGDSIPLLKIDNLPIESKLDAEAEIGFVVRPYTPALVDIFELSSSQISPVKAKITLHFYDINGNWVNREAHCLLYEYEAPPSTAVTTGANRRTR